MTLLFLCASFQLETKERQMERMRFESKIALIAKRYNLSYKWTALRFGYRRVEIECEDFDEAYAVSCMLQRHKGVWSKWAADGHTVYAMDATAHDELMQKVREANRRVNEWWERYHVADAETRRLMACGAIE